MTGITWQNILPWILGICGMAFLFTSYQQTKQKYLIACKLGADVMWVLHYLSLNAYAGAIPNFVGIFRELIFVQREKHKWARCPIWPVVFIAANFTLSILKWQSPISLLPLLASPFVTLSLWAKKPKITRMICLPVSICFIIYDLLIPNPSWIGVINESIGIISIVSSILRNDVTKKEHGKVELKHEQGN